MHHTVRVKLCNAVVVHMEWSLKRGGSLHIHGGPPFDGNPWQSLKIAQFNQFFDRDQHQREGVQRQGFRNDLQHEYIAAGRAGS